MGLGSLCCSVLSGRDDAELLGAWCEGDEEAAAVLIRRHSRDLFRFFSGKAGEEIDDLMQQTVLECVEHRRQGRPIENFRALLFTIARRRLVDHVRKRRLRRPVDLDTEPLPDARTTPSQRVARDRDERVLLESLRSLPLDTQILLELFYWQGLSGPELATVMGIPEGTVRSRIRAARTQLSRQAEKLSSSKIPLRDTMSRLGDWTATTVGAGTGEPR